MRKEIHRRAKRQVDSALEAAAEAPRAHRRVLQPPACLAGREGHTGRTPGRNRPEA